MPKYEVARTYTSTDIYEVWAVDEDHAWKKVKAGNTGEHRRTYDGDDDNVTVVPVGEGYL
jgi:hypothetical protein